MNTKYPIQIFLLLTLGLFQGTTLEAQFRQQSIALSSFNAEGEKWTDVFEESPKFEKGSTILHAGIGIIDDAHIKQFNTKLVVPAVSIMWEKGLGSNFGFGILLAGQSRKVDDLNLNYNYFNAAARFSYHFNAGEKFDPYCGISFTTRYMEVRTEGKARSKFKITTIPIIGTRYYLSNRLAIFAEAGSDVITYFRGGIAIKTK